MPTCTRSFRWDVNGRKVIGEAEGDARWTVFAWLPASGRIRIGVLLGSRRRYAAQSPSGRVSFEAPSRRGAIEALLAWAALQPGWLAVSHPASRAAPTRGKRLGQLPSADRP